MEANELRMFNAIKRFGQIVYVNEHTFEDVKINNGSYSPIELTEDWLLKMRFEKLGWDYWNGPVYFELADCGNGEWINSINCHEYDNGVKIKYVHQLQNLYFALTNTELTINL